MAGKFVEQRIKRKEILMNKGSANDSLYFVVSGLLRAYCYNSDGKEITVMFARKDWWITDMNSFVNRSSSTVTLEAIKNSVVLKISYEGLNELFEEVPNFNTLWRILFQNAYCREQERVVQFLTHSAVERYQLFLQKYPEVASLITQRQLASYLGITPEFLSAIKANLKIP